MKIFLKLLWWWLHNFRIYFNKIRKARVNKASRSESRQSQGTKTEAQGLPTLRGLEGEEPAKETEGVREAEGKKEQKN